MGPGVGPKPEKRGLEEVAECPAGIGCRALLFHQVLFSPRLNKQPDSGVPVTEQKVALLSWTEADRAGQPSVRLLTAGMGP